MKRFISLFFFLTATIALVLMFPLLMWFFSEGAVWMFYVMGSLFVYSSAVFIVKGYKEEMLEWGKRRLITIVSRVFWTSFKKSQ